MARQPPSLIWSPESPYSYRLDPKVVVWEILWARSIYIEYLNGPNGKGGVREAAMAAKRSGGPN